MTFDDGIVKIYRVTNGSQNGEIPRKVLTLKDEAYYQEISIGVTRHYEAVRAGVQISALIGVWDETDVKTNDIVVLNDEDIQYRVERVEPDYDKKNLRIKKATLVTNEDKYEIINIDAATD